MFRALDFFYNKQVSDTSGFKKLYKYATFWLDS